MTIQTVFDQMRVHDNAFNLLAGGADVARGLIAVNLVQDWWEMVCASITGICQTDETITTTANQDYTTWPARLKRIDPDGVYLLDASGNQLDTLDPIDRVGGHQPGGGPFGSLFAPISGAPTEYYATKGSKIRWSPTPSAVHTIRIYGLWAVADYTAAADTFGYDDDVALAVATFATKVLRAGLDRDLTAIHGMAERSFAKAAKSMATVVSGASSVVYGDYHDT